MDRRVRYELLPDEEEDLHTEGEDTTVVDVPEDAITEQTPPDYQEATAQADGVAPPASVSIQHEGTETKIPEPPSYNIATSLPSYEEAEQTKVAEEQLKEQQREQSEQVEETGGSPTKIGDVYLGTDGIFLCSFLLALVFNFLGLFAILFVSQTIAARFGAVAGFGLSIVKFVCVAVAREWMTKWQDEFSWLWWFMLFLGLLMFFRGCFQYIRIKRQWSKLSDEVRGRLYLYF